MHLHAGIQVSASRFRIPQPKVKQATDTAQQQLPINQSTNSRPKQNFRMNFFFFVNFLKVQRLYLN
jgi:hypothetical protein